MFPEPPDPEKNWVKGLILLAFLLTVYFIMREGLNLIFGLGY